MSVNDLRARVGFFRVRRTRGPQRGAAKPNLSDPDEEPNSRLEIRQVQYTTLPRKPIVWGRTDENFGICDRGEEDHMGGPLEEYPLENYPDYISGNPPRTEILEDFSYLDELPRIRGKRWGSQGIGRLREGSLVRLTEHE